MKTTVVPGSSSSETQGSQRDFFFVQTGDCECGTFLILAGERGVVGDVQHKKKKKRERKKIRNSALFLSFFFFFFSLAHRVLRPERPSNHFVSAIVIFREKKKKNSHAGTLAFH
jgi:hypothetical protein